MFRAFDLSGKVVVVTGGNSGLGLGMAEGLAQAGATLCIWGTSNEKNNSAEKLLATYGAPATAMRVDVGSESEVIDAMSQTVSKYGRIDAVFANAAATHATFPFVEFPTEAYRKTLSVNLDGAFWTLREACKHMVARAKNGDEGGSLVSIASLAGIAGAPRNEAYAASKAGIAAVTKSIANGYARYGIRANTIVPGWFATDRTASRAADAVIQQKVTARIPARRWGNPVDLAGLAIYLVSDASSYHTGDVVVVDGGYSVF